MSEAIEFIPEMDGSSTKWKFGTEVNVPITTKVKICGYTYDHSGKYGKLKIIVNNGSNMYAVMPEDITEIKNL